jgi:hypothetical protein
MRYVLASAIASLFMFAGVTGGTAATEPRAHGHGETAFQQFSFEARGTPVDAKGHVVAHIPNPLDPSAPQIVVQGRVTCLNVIPGVAGAGDRAVLTGPVYNVQHFPVEFAGLEFDRFYVVVEDNDKASPSAPDRWNGSFYKAGTLGDIEEQLRDCRALLPFGNALIKGDIVVEPAT